MMPSNNNYAAWVYGSLQRNAARFCSTERLQTQILCGGMSACGRTRSVMRQAEFDPEADIPANADLVHAGRRKRVRAFIMGTRDNVLKA